MIILPAVENFLFNCISDLALVLEYLSFLTITKLCEYDSEKNTSLNRSIILESSDNGGGKRLNRNINQTCRRK